MLPGLPKDTLLTRTITGQAAPAPIRAHLRQVRLRHLAQDLGTKRVSTTASVHIKQFSSIGNINFIDASIWPRNWSNGKWQKQWRNCIQGS